MRWITFFVYFLLCVPLHAQEREETLADIRQDLSYLYVEIQRLKRELSTTQAPSGVMSNDTILQRVNAIEFELQRLTNKTERLEFRVNKLVEDGTSRIGDLEFRLVELEGGDISQLGETTTLGGELELMESQITEMQEVELTVGEEADFDLALVALDEKRFEEAAEMFKRFGKTYPTSPLAPKAYLMRGKALEANQDFKGSARAYLESFSNYQNSKIAPEALSRLGKALVKLGQIEAGCQMLSQVEIRFPDTPFAEEASDEMQTLECL